jgi:hypothetical protein
MTKFLLCCCAGAFLLSCNNGETTKAPAATDSSATIKADKPAVDLPYTASYSSDFTTDVSDADLKTVLVSYKDWADGNMANVAKAYTDTLLWDRPSGERLRLPNAGIMKVWSTYRDSLSSIVIDMQAWQKIYAADKKHGWVATWYKETDTYKSGKADSGYYHDLNLLTDGKISYVEQYKRPAK